MRCRFMRGRCCVMRFRKTQNFERNFGTSAETPMNSLCILTLLI